MTYEARADLELADPDLLASDLVYDKTAGKHPQSHGKQRRRKVAPETVGQAQGRTRRPVEMDLRARIVQRSEEAQSLDVVHMEERQEEIDTPDGSVELGAEAADAGPRVEYQHGSLRPTHLDARGIASVADGVGPGRRDGPSGPPQGHVHDALRRSTRSLPEDEERAEQAISLADHGDDRQLDGAHQSVEGFHDQRLVDGTALGEGSLHGQRARWQRVAGLVHELHPRRQLGRGQLAGLVEAAADDALGRIVVEEHVEVGIDNTDRRGHAAS